MACVILGLGSNLGNRINNINRAVRYLNILGHVAKCSKVYVSPPMSNSIDPNYFNAVVAVKTNLSPFLILRKIKIIERLLGRPIKYNKWSSRIIDIDIITYGNMIIRNRTLDVPHRYYASRAFVTLPMLDLNPTLTKIAKSERFGPHQGINPTTHRITYKPAFYSCSEMI